MQISMLIGIKNSKIQNILQQYRLIQLHNQSPSDPALDMTWLGYIRWECALCRVCLLVARLVSASDRDWSWDVETWPEWRSGGHQTRLTGTPPPTHPSIPPIYIWILDILDKVKSNQWSFSVLFFCFYDLLFTMSIGICLYNWSSRSKSSRMKHNHMVPARLYLL